METSPKANKESNFGCRTIELFIPEIRELLQNKNYIELKSFLSELNPIDLADGFSSFTPEEQILIFNLLPNIRKMEVFEELDFDHQAYVLQHSDDQSLTPLLADIPADVAAKIIKKLHPKTLKKMTSLMNRERIEVAQDILEYPPHTVGAIMKTNFIHVAPDTTAKATISILQARSRIRNEENLTFIFITNGNRRFIGGVSLQTLISAPSDIQVKEIMSAMSPIRIPVTMDREEAANIFTRYKLTVAPVINEEGQLVGVLEAEDVIQVIEQEDTEDIQKLAGVQALELPYFKTKVMDMVKKRAPWLSVLFLGQTLTASAMGFFESEIAKAAVLALFIPLVISSGGNSGSQAATLIVRALSLKQISFRDWWHVIRREFVSGLFLGLILGLLGFFGIFAWGYFSHLYGPEYPLVAATVGLALLLIVIWGSLMGSLLPIILKKLGLDPAVASAPFVATLVDVTGLIIYFSVATLILKGTLL